MSKHMKTQTLVLSLTLAGTSLALAAEELSSWEHAPTDYKVPPGMVRGGAFIDRILPMPVENGLRSDVWGGDNVKPRNVDNGLEDPKWSYWCMEEFPSGGKEHMFAVRWPESSPKGHMTWPNSSVVHAVADKPTGPFKVVQEIGPGHNVRCYQAKDGTYMIYVINGAYTSKSLDGPWTRYKLEYDLRGTPKVSMSNHTFVRREDGSYYMMSRDGHVWISEDGLKPYKKITTKSAYPPIKGNFEDPVVWKDEVQYHLIVNDWFGRTAYYLRSKDGVDWDWDQGKAYDVNIARHPEGSLERWYKFERPAVRQDATGRATHIYFAVIDSRKDLDLGNDNHSSKIIALPLVSQRRLEILNAQSVTASAGEVRVAVKAEEGFDPTAEADVASLFFGAPASVDFGKGSKAVKSETRGKDLVVTFAAAATGFKPEDFAGKLLGRNRRGELLFGYVRMPGHQGLTPLISQRPAKLDKPEALTVVVENFGLVASQPTPMKTTLRNAAGKEHVAESTIPALAPYAGNTVSVPLPAGFLEPGTKGSVKTVITPMSSRPVEIRSSVEVPK